jgi:cytidylate kinase
MDKPRRVDVEHLVERQINLWNAEMARRRAAEATAESVEEGLAPYIAVSRQLGSRGNELAGALAEELGYQLWDREIVDYIAERANVRVAAVKSLGETWYNRAHDWIAGTIDRRFLACDEYVRHLVEVVTAMATHGPCVFLGRGVGFFMPPERGLRVRVVAPIEQRVAYAAENYDMDITEARKLVNRSDASKEGFVRTYFRVDLGSPLSHDLCLNLGSMSVEEAVAVCLSAHRAKFGTTPTPSAAEEASVN